ncbi:MAG: ribosome-binding factor A [Planctomycetes bacterium]|nr:ribosome-binding factor A [Planctomycetota bacterium]
MSSSHDRSRARKHRARRGRLPVPAAEDLDLFFPSRRASSHDEQRERKSIQLAAQIEECVRELLERETRDESLQELSVLGAHVLPGAAHVAVVLRVPRRGELALWRAKLERARGWLRTEIARAIHRKRTPELVFELLESSEEAS